MYKKINVSDYSGGRCAERPSQLLLDDRIIDVEVIYLWIEEDFASKRRKRFFRLRDTEDKEYEVYYDEATSVWLLRV
jgi:hypothetical protein